MDLFRLKLFVVDSYCCPSSSLLSTFLFPPSALIERIRRHQERCAAAFSADCCPPERTSLLIPVDWKRTPFSPTLSHPLVIHFLYFLPIHFPQLSHSHALRLCLSLLVLSGRCRVTRCRRRGECVNLRQRFCACVHLFISCVCVRKRKMVTLCCLENLPGPLLAISVC